MLPELLILPPADPLVRRFAKFIKQGDADPPIREIVLGKITQDDAIAQQLNLPLRAEIQRAREFIVEGGFRRLFDELDKGTLLPAVGIPLISLGLASRDNETR